MENGDQGRLRNAWLDFAVYSAISQALMVPVLLGLAGRGQPGGAGARYSGLCASSVSDESDRLDGIRVARPTGYPLGITTVEQYRVARSPN